MNTLTVEQLLKKPINKPKHKTTQAEYVSDTIIVRVAEYINREILRNYQNGHSKAFINVPFMHDGFGYGWTKDPRGTFEGILDHFRKFGYTFSNPENANEQYLQIDWGWFITTISWEK